MNRKPAGFALVAAAALAAAAAQADRPAAGNTPTYPGIAADSAGWFGSKAAMDVWADDLNYYLQGDNRINQVFGFNGDVSRQQRLKQELEAIVLGAPVDPGVGARYGLNLSATQYNALVENAYLACDASRTPYHVCNRIVAALAPFERAVVTR